MKPLMWYAFWKTPDQLFSDKGILLFDFYKNHTYAGQIKAGLPTPTVQKAIFSYWITKVIGKKTTRLYLKETTVPK